MLLCFSRGWASGWAAVHGQGLADSWGASGVRPPGSAHRIGGTQCTGAWPGFGKPQKALSCPILPLACMKPWLGHQMQVAPPCRKPSEPKCVKKDSVPFAAITLHVHLFVCM